MRLGILLTFCACAPLAAAQSADQAAAAAERSLDRPAVLIVPFPPGGSADRVAKVLAASLGTALQRPVATRYVAAGAGTEALKQVAQPGDGEVRLGYATSTTVVAGSLLGGAAAYNPINDFDWIGIVGTFGNAVIVGPAETAPTFDAWMKSLPARPRPLRAGVGAVGAMSTLAAQFLAGKLGVPAEYLIVNRADEGYALLSTGQIDVLFDGLPNALEEAPRARGRIIAVTSARRATPLPDVPSFSEPWPGADFSLFVALVIAKAESDAARARARSGWHEVNRAGAARAQLEAMGLRYLGVEQPAAARFIDDEYVRHARLLSEFPQLPQRP